MNKKLQSDEEAFRVAYLIAGYIRGTLSEAEQDELDDWVNASDQNMLLFEDLTDERNVEMNMKLMESARADEAFERLKSSGALRPRRRFPLVAIWIAATILIFLAILFLFFPAGGGKAPAPVAGLGDTSIVAPAVDRATLTLADGSVIDLGARSEGVISDGGRALLRKEGEGALVYEGGAEGIGMHVLATPVGGQYSVLLPDGTRAWLNAASSLRYPAAFGNGERVVELRGEAYFEVVGDVARPFLVRLQESGEVRVLGTRFNVKSYGGEETGEVTTVEGSVEVRSGGEHVRLERGEQARMGVEGLRMKAGVDTAEVLGWKQGWFIFHDASIENIMRQVERWYGVEVVYEGKTGQLFNARILRGEPLHRLLHLLELNGYVHFRIQNRRVYVLP